MTMETAQRFIFRASLWAGGMIMLGLFAGIVTRLVSFGFHLVA